MVFDGSSCSVARDFNLTVAAVLAKQLWQRSFAQLPLSTVLNVSRWADFRESAREAPLNTMLNASKKMQEACQKDVIKGHEGLDVFHAFTP